MENTTSFIPQKKKRRTLVVVLQICSLVFVIAVICGLFYQLFLSNKTIEKAQTIVVPEWITVALIDVDGNARRGEKLDSIKDIVIHYVGNPGTTAQQNRSFFANPKSGISSHFLVGLEGEILQCVPLDEKSSASNWRNNDTISIEVCHPTKTGKFNPDTYQSLVRLTAWLCENFSLENEHIIRHYDITGKECPRYYVKHEKAWVKLKKDVAAFEAEK